MISNFFNGLFDIWAYNLMWMKENIIGFILLIGAIILVTEFVVHVVKAISNYKLFGKAIYGNFIKFYKEWYLTI